MDIKKIYGDMGDFSPQRLAENNKAQQVAAKQNNDTVQQSGDKVALSPQARLLGTALTVASSAEDVRAEKVRSLKEQVQSGTYKPDIKKAAANLLREDLSMLKA